jgi:Protein of unknown function (DUF3301)
MSEFLWLSFGCLAVFYWLFQERQHRLARISAARACRDAQVQWLDQAVVLKSRQVQWQGVGRLPLWVWCFEFEFSRDGLERRSGEIVMHSHQVQWVRIDDLIVQETIH